MANVPKRQNAVFITAAGGPEVLQLRSAPLPEVGEQDVLIECKRDGTTVLDAGRIAVR
jgi:NADPH:quinone reductase-like Zn-dependent oxidoreductase